MPGRDAREHAAKVVAIVQARTGSTRLPGKVLMDLAGEPMLLRVVTRLTRARRIDEAIVATSTLPGDDAITRLCGKRGIACFRGSETDVLDRYYQAARERNADAVVRITSDCPLIDPAVVDEVVKRFSRGRPGLDYASNIHPVRTFPRGLDVEVFSLDALERAWREDDDPALREHVTQYIVRHAERFRTACVEAGEDFSHHRWTVDTPEDLAFVRRIFEHFGRDDFGWREVLGVLAEHPDWAEINRHVRQKTV